MHRYFPFLIHRYFPILMHSYFPVTPIPYVETKSTKYLSDIISKYSNSFPELVSDEDEGIISKLDISYCSIGCGNLKTNEILESKRNRFIYFNSEKIITKTNDLKEYTQIHKYDIGVILKIFNSNFPKRVQIFVAGIGEYGTSGAAWFLSHKWMTIEKKVGTKEFCVILKVKNGFDESSEILDILY